MIYYISCNNCKVTGKVEIEDTLDMPVILHDGLEMIRVDGVWESYCSKCILPVKAYAKLRKKDN